jgi:hypothetical protein
MLNRGYKGGSLHLRFRSQKPAWPPGSVHDVELARQRREKVIQCSLAGTELYDPATGTLSTTASLDRLLQLTRRGSFKTAPFWSRVGFNIQPMETLSRPDVSPWGHPLDDVRGRSVCLC